MTRSGGVVTHKGLIYARVRLGGKKRMEVRIPWAKTEAQAVERAALIAELCEQLIAAGRRDLVRATATEAAAATTAKRLAGVRAAVAGFVKGLHPIPDGELSTFEDVAEEWITGALRKKFPDHVRRKVDFGIERARLKRYIYPHIKDVPVAAFEKAHADLVMSKLPAERVKASATRRHVAQIIARVLNLAVMPLGLIKSSPLPKGFLPRIESQRHYTCVFPREEAKLLACKEVAEADRLFFGILDREGMRVSELVDSEWSQWNLDEGTFTATKTKTNDPRMWAIRPDVARAMRIWQERHGKTKKRPFIDVAADEKSKVWIATRLRDGLKLAGVTRTELFESTEHTGKMRAHDLRATFVTVSLAEGKNDTWIRDRTAHKTMTMVDRYRRAARQFEELNVGSLVDLVQGLGWVKTWVKLAVAVGDDTADSDEESGGSDGRIRTFVRGIKILCPAIRRRRRDANNLPQRTARAKLAKARHACQTRRGEHGGRVRARGSALRSRGVLRGPRGLGGALARDARRAGAPLPPGPHPGRRRAAQAAGDAFARARRAPLRPRARQARRLARRLRRRARLRPRALSRSRAPLRRRPRGAALRPCRRPRDAQPVAGRAIRMWRRSQDASASRLTSTFTARPTRGRARPTAGSTAPSEAWSGWAAGRGSVPAWAWARARAREAPRWSRPAGSAASVRAPGAGPAGDAARAASAPSSCSCRPCPRRPRG